MPLLRFAAEQYPVGPTSTQFQSKVVDVHLVAVQGHKGGRKVQLSPKRPSVPLEIREIQFRKVHRIELQMEKTKTLGLKVLRLCAQNSEGSEEVHIFRNYNVLMFRSGLLLFSQAAPPVQPKTTPTQKGSKRYEPQTTWIQCMTYTPPSSRALRPCGAGATSQTARSSPHDG